jgi:hypothetical protein
MKKADFGFGIETEFLMVKKDDFTPLCHRDLDFEMLAELINSISTSDFGKDGFNIKPLHSKATPYLIEGYYLTDSDMNKISLLPKGIEIRTPKSESISEAISALRHLFERLRQRTLSDGFDLVVISHHPTESKFNAPPNYIRHDYWQWALTAATTFGPDINISVPEELSKRIEPAQVAARINFYMPSVVAMTLAAPLTDGKLWRIRRRIGKSIRTYRRSIWAPLFYVHEEPSLRFEFKGFEMSRCLEDYNVFFLLSLALLLDETLTEQGADESRIYDLGRVAVVGLESQYTRDVASKVMESAEKIANRFGLSREGMDEFWNRLQSKRIPADDIISIHQKENSVAKTLSRLVGLYSRNDLRAEGAACATGTR